MKNLTVSEEICSSRDMYEEHRTGLPQTDSRSRSKFELQDVYLSELAARNNANVENRSNLQNINNSINPSNESAHSTYILIEEAEFSHEINTEENALINDTNISEHSGQIDPITSETNEDNVVTETTIDINFSIELASQKDVKTMPLNPLHQQTNPPSSLSLLDMLSLAHSPPPPPLGVTEMEDM